MYLDATRNLQLNGVRVTSERIADELHVPTGEIVTWDQVRPETPAFVFTQSRPTYEWDEDAEQYRITEWGV